MSDASSADDQGGPPILADTVPVVMPELPAQRVLTTMQEFKAVSDETRSRILGLIQQQPVTAKQIAVRLGATPGAIGHHLHLLEAAGLAQVVARRFIRGTVASYYTRTARIFQFDFPREIVGDDSQDIFSPRMLRHAHDELSETLARGQDDPGALMTLMHPRLTPERVRYYHQRIEALMNDIIHEAPDASGDVYSIVLGMFTAPDHLQGSGSLPVDDSVTIDN